MGGRKERKEGGREEERKGKLKENNKHCLLENRFHGCSGRGVMLFLTTGDKRINPQLFHLKTPYRSMSLTVLSGPRAAAAPQAVS